MATNKQYKSASIFLLFILFLLIKSNCLAPFAGMVDHLLVGFVGTFSPRSKAWLLLHTPSPTYLCDVNMLYLFHLVVQQADKLNVLQFRLTQQSGKSIHFIVNGLIIWDRANFEKIFAILRGTFGVCLCSLNIHFCLLQNTFSVSICKPQFSLFNSKSNKFGD